MSTPAPRPSPAPPTVCFLSCFGLTVQLEGSGDGDSAKTVLLVSGVGQPRNERHRVEDNSTEITAILMEGFLKRRYPDVRVLRVHSNTNIFRCVFFSDQCDL